MLKRRAKYRAEPTIVDGIRFASKREAKRYGELKLLERAGRIAHLILQPVYHLMARPLGGNPGDLTAVAIYIGDFQYEELANGCWRIVVEDVKGVRTPIYRLKKKFVEIQYGIQIREI